MARSSLASGVSTSRAATRPRPALSRELVLEAAARLTAEQPTSTLTLARLGAELSADPTAFYRHFRSREELVLALGDWMFGQVAQRFERHDDLLVSLRTVARLIRTEFLQRPAVAAEVAHRFTGGPHEREGIAIIVGIFTNAGFDPEEAHQQARVFGAFVLAHTAYSAALKAQPAEVHAADARLAHELYGTPLDMQPDDYESDTFERSLDLYLAGVRAMRDAALRHEPTSTQGGTQ